MQGTIVNFRRGRTTQTDNHMIVVVSGFDKKDKTKSLLGKEVIWKSPAGKAMKGKIASSHGNKGAVRVIFETGMPGQAIGEKVEIN
jgi:large subunit ribosomal protein L35Ae